MAKRAMPPHQSNMNAYQVAATPLVKSKQSSGGGIFSAIGNMFSKAKAA